MRDYFKSNPGIFDMDQNPNAKWVIRLSDLKLYTCGKEAALENGIIYSTFKGRCQKG